MEKELLEQVVHKLKDFGLKRWLKKIDGSVTSYSTNTSNFEIIIRKDMMSYDLKIKGKRSPNYNLISFDSYEASTKKLLAGLVNELELKESSNENYRELLLEGLLEELK